VEKSSLERVYTLAEEILTQTGNGLSGQEEKDKEKANSTVN